MTFGPTITPEVIAAFTEARRLENELGREHPRALAAIVQCVALADPGFADRAKAGRGFRLPAATHCDADGNARFTVGQIASALGVPVAEVEARARELAGAGLIQQVDPGEVHLLN